MFSRLLFGGYVITLGLSAPRLAAQDLAAVARRIDSVNAQAGAAREALYAYRKTRPRHMTGWSDSAVIGAGRVTVYFNAEMARYAKAGAAEADAQLRSLGTALTPLPQVDFSVVPDTALTRYDNAGADMVNVRFHPTPTTANRTSTGRDPKSIALVIVSHVSQAAMDRADGSLREWLSAPLPLDARTRENADWGTLRLDIVSSPSPLGRKCHGGDIAACRKFLGLDPVADPVMDLYDAAGRRALVAQGREHALRVGGVLTRRCESGDDASCESVLKLLSQRQQPPATPYARMSLLARAISLGGDGAGERLVTAKGSAANALTAAARVPLDTLVASWQRDMRERGTASSNLSLPVLLSSILWIALCGFLALRSSRWR